MPGTPRATPGATADATWRATSGDDRGAALPTSLAALVLTSVLTVGIAELADTVSRGVAAHTRSQVARDALDGAVRAAIARGTCDTSVWDMTNTDGDPVGVAADGHRVRVVCEAVTAADDGSAAVVETHIGTIEGRGERAVAEVRRNADGRMIDVRWTWSTGSG